MNSEKATPPANKVHNYAVRGMGSVRFLHLPYPAVPGQNWTWFCPQDANLTVPGFGVTMGDTFRIDRCIDGEEPDPREPECGKLHRSCEVTFVGNKNLDPKVPEP